MGSRDFEVVEDLGGGEIVASATREDRRHEVERGEACLNESVDIPDGDVGGTDACAHAFAYRVWHRAEGVTTGSYHLDAMEDWYGRMGAVRLSISLDELKWRFGGEAGLRYEEVGTGFDFTMSE